MRLRKLLVLPLVALALGACDDEDDGITASENARVTVLLTDAPGDLASVDVTVEQIYLTGAPEGEESGEEGRVVLFDGDASFDLLDLRGGVAATLGEDVVVPAGTYSQIRFVLGEATITTEDGEVYSTEDGTLRCPSCAESGLKVKLPDGSVRLDSDSEIILLDFDVSQSFAHQAGNSGFWVMQPVIRATHLETEDATGSIEGTVTVAADLELPLCGGAPVDLSDFVPQATAGDVTLTGTTSAEGEFEIHFVPPGTYALGFAETVEFDDGDVLTFTDVTATPAQVTVEAGETATAEITIGGVACTG